LDNIPDMKVSPAEFATWLLSNDEHAPQPNDLTIRKQNYAEENGFIGQQSEPY